jgi:redox-sensitive bicupin YhaK (pirin superfamily)
MNTLFEGGDVAGFVGPFKTKVRLQIVDYELEAASSIDHFVHNYLNNVLIYVYNGSGTINGRKVSKNEVVHLDATNESRRNISLSAGEQGATMLLFAGERLNEPVAWHGTSK